ncbi:MAG: hypothetical protein H7Y37_18340 [Anaerolineae bacterium]|nr:hypothetical protein [Gloeobacterales cyanobacterium ES-bin-313]
MISSQLTLPFCRECGHQGSMATHPTDCDARPTYGFEIGETRLPDCHCTLPCPSFQCAVCGQERPFCFGATDDWEEVCDHCYGAASARGETLQPFKRVKS